MAARRARAAAWANAAGRDVDERTARGPGNHGPHLDAATRLIRSGMDRGSQRRIRHDRMRSSATQLIQASPDVIIGQSVSGVNALFQATRTIPVVFLLVSDPVGSGFVQSFARPGGNLTGFSYYEPGMSGKCIEFLRDLKRRSRNWRSFYLSHRPGVERRIPFASTRIGVERSQRQRRAPSRPKWRGRSSRHSMSHLGSRTMHYSSFRTLLHYRNEN